MESAALPYHWCRRTSGECQERCINNGTLMGHREGPVPDLSSVMPCSSLHCVFASTNGLHSVPTAKLLPATGSLHSHSHSLKYYLFTSHITGILLIPQMILSSSLFLVVVFLKLSCYLIARILFITFVACFHPKYAEVFVVPLFPTRLSAPRRQTFSVSLTTGSPQVFVSMNVC